MTDKLETLRQYQSWRKGVDVRITADDIDEAIDWAIAELEKRQAVPDGWRTAKDGKDWPKIGDKYLIRIGPDSTLQNEVYEFDMTDCDSGAVDYYWCRDDLDECPPFDSENDSWFPLSALDAMLNASPQPPGSG